VLSLAEIKNNKTKPKTVLRGCVRAILLAVLCAVHADVVFATNAACQEPDCQPLLLAAYVGGVESVRPSPARDGRADGVDYLSAGAPNAESAPPVWIAQFSPGGQESRDREESASSVVTVPEDTAIDASERAARVLAPAGTATLADGYTQAGQTGEEQVGLPGATMALALALLGVVAVARRSEPGTTP